jgi:ethanolamine utilization protein EutA
MGRNAHELLSVGIDIGTTTTQVVFSRLLLEEQAFSGHIRRITITDKQILYRGKISLTPLADRDTLEVQALEAMLRSEYSRAGVNPQEVDTGAVIITGETAKKRNADKVLEIVAGLAGEFVVTVAGPHVESLIAGRGSGAAAYARRHFTTVTNVDIGGGSANMAVFRQGQAIADAAMNFGGRLIEIDRASGTVSHISAPAHLICDHQDIALAVGARPLLGDLRRFTDSMAGLAVDLIEGRADSLAGKLLLTPPATVSGKETILFFSGGVGLHYYDPVPADSLDAVAIHGDVGPLLAVSLREHAGLAAYEIHRPPETMGATVLGASAQTVTLSGSTIWAEPGLLPIRNVPVTRPVLPGTLADPEAVAQAVAQAVLRWDIDLSQDYFAIALDLILPLDYEALIQLSTGLARFVRQHLPANRPLVIIIERDYARALGQTLKALVPMQPLLVIDQVGLEEGDFIDLGTPVMDGRAVPLSVKTLVFYSN